MSELRRKMEGRWTTTVKLRIVVSDCLKGGEEEER